MVRGYSPEETSFMLPLGEPVLIEVAFSTKGPTYATFLLDGETRVETRLHPDSVDFSATVPPQAPGEYQARLRIEGTKAGAAVTDIRDETSTSSTEVVADVTWQLTVVDPEELREFAPEDLTELMFDVLSLYTEGCVDRDTFLHVRPYMETLPEDVQDEITMLYDIGD